MYTLSPTLNAQYVTREVGRHGPIQYPYQACMFPDHYLTIWKSFVPFENVFVAVACATACVHACKCILHCL